MEIFPMVSTIMAKLGNSITILVLFCVPPDPKSSVISYFFDKLLIFFIYPR